MLQLDRLLEQAREAFSGEVIIMAGDAPAMRLNGDWQRYIHPRCSPADVESLVRSILPAGNYDDLWTVLADQRELEFEYVSPTAGIVLCNVHFQRGSLVLLMRLADDFNSDR